MTGIWLPLAATALAAVLTYLCCIRPMRRHGGCVPATPERTECTERTEQSVEAEIRRTREERDLLRARATVETDLVAASDRGPETVGP